MDDRSADIAKIKQRFNENGDISKWDVLTLFVHIAELQTQLKKLEDQLVKSQEESLELQRISLDGR